MPKFFISKEHIKGNSINIYGDDVSHIKKVLRLKSGEDLMVCDGEGTDYIVRIDSLEKDFIKTDIISTVRNNAEPPVEITLFQGIPKSDKMDLIIQKSVELGVKQIVPVVTERTVVRIDNQKDAENKRTRWQRIAFEAAKQCSRGVIPKVGMPVTFSESLEMVDEDHLCLIPYEKETGNGLKSLLKANTNKKSISIFIGPEGGFAEKEVENAVKARIKPVTLGPRILRTETAGIAVISIIMYELGDVGK